MSVLNIALLTDSQHPTLGAFILHIGCQLEVFNNLDDFLVQAVTKRYDLVLCQDKFLQDENTEDRLFRLLQRNKKLKLFILTDKLKYYKFEVGGAFHEDDLSSLKEVIQNQIKESSTEFVDLEDGDESIIEIEEESVEQTQGAALVFSAETLKNSQTFDELGKSLLKCFDILGLSKRALLFKYLPNYCSLVVLGGKGFRSSQKFNGVGLNFSSAKDFRPDRHLSSLVDVPAFSKILNKAFGSVSTEQLTVSVEQVPRLILIVEGREADESYQQLKTLSLLAEERAHHIHLKTLYFNAKEKDSLTGLLTREVFFDRMQDEYMRARRIFLPVTSLLIRIDNFSHLKDEYNTERINTLLKMISKVLIENIRHNDFIGRVSESRFGIVFPHMSLTNAQGKIKKLRKVISQTQFFSDMKESLSVTLSVVYLTYPNYSRSADEALLSLENTLDQSVIEDSVIELIPREGFRPDFEEIELPFSKLGRVASDKQEVNKKSS